MEGGFILTEGGLDYTVAGLFPQTVKVAVSNTSSEPPPLWPAEAKAVATAVASRRREFAIGRACARDALTRLGFSAQSIPSGPDRTPIWPQGAIGSITHCEGFCAAATARSREVMTLGLDAERPGSLSKNTLALIVRDEEKSAFPETGSADFDWGTVAFSAKEAFYKAYFMVARAYLDFHDVAVRFQIDQPGEGSFSVDLRHTGKPHKELANAIEGRWWANNSLVLCGSFVVGS